MIVHFHGQLGARVQRLKYLLKLREVLVSLEKYIPGIIPEYSKIHVVNVFLLHFLSCQLGFGLDQSGAMKSVTTNHKSDISPGLRWCRRQVSPALGWRWRQPSGAASLVPD